MSKKLVGMLAMIAVMSVFAVGVQAQTVTWDGSTDMNWTQPDTTSWSGDTYESGNNVEFLGDGAGTVNVDAGGVTPGNMVVDASVNSELLTSIV